MKRLDIIKGLMDAFIIAFVVSIIPIDITTSADNSVTTVTCLNGLLVTYASDSVTHELRYVELQSGSIGYSLYERNK